MAVLVQGAAVVVRLEQLAHRWGSPAVERLCGLLPPHRLCMDGELASLWCWDAAEARRLEAWLSGHAHEGQEGLLVRVELGQGLASALPAWLDLARPEVARGRAITVARLRGGCEPRIFAPWGWRPAAREAGR